MKMNLIGRIDVQDGSDRFWKLTLEPEDDLDGKLDEEILAYVRGVFYDATYFDNGAYFVSGVTIHMTPGSDYAVGVAHIRADN